jgi:excisionase family DNA binding protein
MSALTTHQAARLLGVSLPTVVKWIKQGRLEAYKTPGGHRRIPETALKQFCQEFGMPAPGLLEASAEAPKVQAIPLLLLASYEQDFAELIRDFMRIRVETPIQIASSVMQCGMALGKQGPVVLLIDQLHSNVDPTEVAALDLPGLSTVVLAETQMEAEAFRRLEFYKVLSRPLELEELLEALGLALAALST